MELKAVADMNVIALGTRQCVSVMLDITAPVAPEPQARPAQSVQIVLDRSGSMDGPRLRAAQQAVSALVPRLHPDDCFGMVVFDDHGRPLPSDLVADLLPDHERDVGVHSQSDPHIAERDIGAALAARGREHEDARAGTVLRLPGDGLADEA